MIYTNKDENPNTHIKEIHEFDKGIAIQRLKLSHEHIMKYLNLGMILIILGCINFLFGYMLFESTLMKTLSISVVFILAGVIVFAIGDQELRKIRRAVRRLEKIC
ncbi:MAG: hypothetical protein QXG00_00670 [Candidatus Woesearchaeota archaeon]